jgi:hypothetical protein
MMLPSPVDSGEPLASLLDSKRAAKLSKDSLWVLMD